MQLMFPPNLATVNEVVIAGFGGRDVRGRDIGRGQGRPKRDCAGLLRGGRGGRGKVGGALHLCRCNENIGPLKIV